LNSTLGTRNPELGTWNSELGTRNPELGTRNSELGTRNYPVDLAASRHATNFDYDYEHRCAEHEHKHDEQRTKHSTLCPYAITLNVELQPRNPELGTIPRNALQAPRNPVT